MSLELSEQEQFRRQSLDELRKSTKKRGNYEYECGIMSYELKISGLS